MATYKVRYLQTRRRQNGTLRHLWQPSEELRKAGWRIERLPDDEAQAIARAEQLNRDLDAWYKGVAQQNTGAAAGTLRAVVENYRRSHHYTELSKRTRFDYDWNIRILEAWAADTPVCAISPRVVEALYTKHKAATPAKANALVRTLRILLSHARRMGLVTDNAASRLNLSYKPEKGMLWTPEAVQLIAATADELGHYAIGSAILLNEWMGQRQADVINLPASAYKGGIITRRQNKTGATVQLPVDDVPALRARLQLQQEKNSQMFVRTVLLFPSPDGNAYTPRNFAEWIERIRNKAAAKLQAQGLPRPEGHPLHGLENLIYKDLRHTAVTRLAEAGATTPQIAAITGHSFRTCEEIIDRYNIRTKRMAGEAFRLRLAAE